MVRLAEIRLRLENLVRPFVLDVLASVVVGNGLAKMFWNARESSRQRFAHFTGCLGLEIRKPRVSGLALDAHLKSRLALSGYRRVRLPMSGHSAVLDGGRPLGDRNTVGNMGLSVFARVAALLSFLVGSDEKWDEFSRIDIHPLVDGLVAHREIWMEPTPSASDKLGRPSGADAFSDVPADTRFLETVSPMALMISVHGSLMRFVRKVIARVDGRCIPLELTRQGAGIPAELPGDGPKRLSLAP